MNRRELEAWLLARSMRRRAAGAERTSDGPCPVPVPIFPIPPHEMSIRQIRKSATAVDLRAARRARWLDTLGLINGCAPDYLMPMLVYAVGLQAKAHAPNE